MEIYSMENHYGFTIEAVIAAAVTLVIGLKSFPVELTSRACRTSLLLIMDEKN